MRSWLGANNESLPAQVSGRANDMARYHQAEQKKQNEKTKE